ncbi:mandelate racemase/muconate lactonizing enzyme family protein [Siccirubricoccus sp. G192]|uniref:mandelate racemase/muconate lactonizing enzyme family protein n=1 Tax=Siccirubricoccus sp. G192 TaxID=2849651 RepID=UPI001C2C1B40|nr:mandelate racemase/muconate lactonizing enzyme family protein [Siccirubricoccus sp. G192]MBV1799838.1 mandelate racemase/muconate lactonizing enzyme family protein [Siccirubricoccus sp. G192]
MPSSPPRLLGREITDPRATWHEISRGLHLWGLQAGEPGAFAAALAGADIALHDLFARRAGLPLFRWLGGSDASPLPCYASGLNPDAMALEQVEAARARGYRAFKIKIGFGEARDVATLAPIFASLRPGERCMVDINQGWDVAQAVRMAGVLGQFPLTWIEEPLAADRPAWEWAQVRAAASSPLAAGENLRGALAYHEALEAGHLAVVQPDACKWGGFTATLPVAQAVLGAGRSYCPHFLGGGIGQLASLHLLAAVRGPGLLEWDANPNPLREGLLEGVLELHDGLVAPPQGPGLGLVPDLAPFAPHLALHTERRA